MTIFDGMSVLISLDKIKEHMKLVRFISILPDGSRCIRNRTRHIYVHHETHEPINTLASIENL